MFGFDKHLKDINQLCKQYNVKRLYAFGSALNDKFAATSDVDLMVDFEPIAVEDYADNYYDLKFSLENIFKRPVDLLEEKAVKNPYFKQTVTKQYRLIY
jgi:predicted nucleotidyltransferase